MRKLILAIGLLFVSSVSAQLDIVRSGNTGFRCVEVVDSRDVVVSGHAQEYKAIARCQREQLKNPDKTFNVIAKSRLRFEFTGALADVFPADGGSAPGSPPANSAPEWNSTPAPTAQAGVASSYSLLQHASDADGDALTFVNETGCTLPTGVTIDNTNKEIDFSAGTSAGTTAGCVFSADDGTASPVNSSSFSIVISDVSGLCWAAQGAPDSGDYPNGPYPADRNGAGCAPVSPAIGYGEIWGGYSQWPGTNPTIRHVTSRNNAGAGTLRDVLDDHDNSGGCSVVVFDVGGRIQLSSQITIQTGCLTINGHAAPGPVSVTLDSASVTNGILSVRGSDVIIEGLDLAVTGTPACANDRALNVGNGDNIMVLNTIMRGASDQNNSHGRGTNWQFIDSMFANASGSTTCSHHYNALFQDSSGEGFMSGMIFINGKSRSPRMLVENLTLLNIYGYNNENRNLDVSIDTGISSPPTFFVNIADITHIEGPSGFDPNVVLLNSNGTTDFSNASEFSILRVRKDTGMCSDAWDPGCVSINSNTEANVRDDATDRYPTGAASTNISSLSAADNCTLHTQNNGPHPNNRWANISDIYDGICDRTWTTSNTYPYVAPANTTGTYSVPASPHVDGDTDGYPDLMDQFESERQAMYAN